ncbi:MAG: hypothetical protein EHM93_10040 [Bacteroidales bacterium]|nr:MAG: hypothetical protein EHM93_10040 [Bacteroidales bacterium]
MKTIKLLSALVLLATTAIAAVGQDRVAKTYQKEFALTENSNIYLENRFGQMDIENWDKNSISITVEIKVDYPEGDKAARLLKAINIEFAQIGNDISAITKIDEDFIKSWKHLFDSDSKDFSIDWEVKMPKQSSITLVNKYGDIFINELTGKCKVELRYGNLKANRIFRDNSEPLSNLTISYGNASIDEVNWFKAEIKYAKLSITKAKAIVILSRYSKISIDQVSSVVSESKGDSYSIGTISNFVGEGANTAYRMDELTKKLDLTVKYGDVKIDKIPVGFESIKFSGGYSGISARIDPLASYYLTGNAAYGDIIFNTSNRLNRIESPTRLEVEGLIGKDENTKSKVEVTVKYGSAKF